jgi:hypothetical protein
MKLLKELFEMNSRGDLPGPGDYRPGDEYNPRSPDYNPNAGMRRSSSRYSDDDYNPADEYYKKQDIADRKSAEARKQIHAQEVPKDGTNDKGEHYNLTTVITGPDNYTLQYTADTYSKYHSNIYNKFIGSKKEVLGDGIAQITLFIQATPHSLLWPEGQKPAVDPNKEYPKPMDMSRYPS